MRVSSLNLTETENSENHMVVPKQIEDVLQWNICCGRQGLIGSGSRWKKNMLQ
jgi:hypothetical protein